MRRPGAVVEQIGSTVAWRLLQGLRHCSSLILVMPQLLKLPHPLEVWLRRLLLLVPLLLLPSLLLKHRLLLLALVLQPLLQLLVLGT